MGSKQGKFGASGAVACVLPDWISPRAGDKFSPNLHAWIKYRNRWRSPQRLFKQADQTLWIGWFDDEEWFYGCRLMDVLCNGSKAESGAYPGFKCELVECEGFWAQYLAVGRCAIDPKHEMHFVDYYLRWRERGDVRDCLWCNNATQYLTRGEVEIAGAAVPFKAWVSAKE